MAPVNPRPPKNRLPNVRKCRQWRKIPNPPNTSQPPKSRNEGFCGPWNPLPPTHSRDNTRCEVPGVLWEQGGSLGDKGERARPPAFLNDPISFHVQESQTGLKVRGRWLPTSAYDFDKGRKRPELRIWFLIQFFYYRCT